MKWYREAAEQGDAAAQNKLGVAYENGDGVERNRKEAVKWYRKAAEHGHAAAKLRLRDAACGQGNGLQKEMMSTKTAVDERIREADRLAMEQRSAALNRKPLIPNSIGMQFALCPSGTFTMGEGADSHQVTLTEPFHLGIYTVTQEQYQAVMGTNPSKFQGPQNPVEQVSWGDAVEFCRRLSALPAEKSAGCVYRLPTEAEWEYACRAGTTTDSSFGDDWKRFGEYAWYGDNSTYPKTGGFLGKLFSSAQIFHHPIGEKKPNPWGLYDMHGNVWEWCSDWYEDYPRGSVTDPTGPSSGSYRVYRGGSWGNYAWNCRSANRRRNSPGIRLCYLGFRVLRSSVK